MYDFYNNPPQTKQDIREYLVSWLKPVDNNNMLVIRGERFVQEFGFRRAFNYHCVFRSKITGEYVWWVSENEDISNFPITRYRTYDSLIDAIVDDYYTRWNVQPLACSNS